ncbi:hypothetical protein [Actinomadura sp. 21ATH]|uniref:hypothetical protein n=1 Tax=Actinomadura sp. 21ATH TaxID=1735444 RepID=UPI0035BFC550
MTAVSSHDHADGAAPAALRTGRWRLPPPAGARRAAHARRTVHAALRRWGLGPAADTLAQRVVALVQEMTARPAARRYGPIDLHLELRPTDRLLLAEIRGAAPALPESADRPPAIGDGRSIIALTYGHRPARNGIATWYTHAFTWQRPGADTADH